ncbi:hypothetical protein [Citrobacter farmeri]|uniref:hypothetical protein n=2 Tax=Citrobacter farmeri TaxID=67824 RepID=UPI001CED0050|nr:hypothetical protein [Citrobacter farmeri]
MIMLNGMHGDGATMWKFILLLNSQIFIGLLMLCPSIPVLADQFEIVCPEFVSGKTAPVNSVITGWNLSSRSDRIWNDGGFITSGKPEA